jgi:hypothetical protein
MNADLLDDYRWLISDEAAVWLARLDQPAKSYVAQVRLLRRNLSASRAHLLLEQSELRRRAAKKFSAAENLFFTRRGLEQATDQWIARFKADRFPARDRVIDLCCGIGGDLFGLARRSWASAVDSYPIHTLLAAANCEVLNLRLRSVETCDAARIDLRDFEAWHIDPDRRSADRRATRMELFQPPLSEIERMVQSLSPAAVKLAPATDIPMGWQDRAERQWLGSGRECRQQIVWFGNLARHPGRRSAAVIDHRGHASAILVGAPQTAFGVSPHVGRFIFEPHAAVLAADLTGALALQMGLSAVGVGAVYLTGDRLIRDLRLGTFEVLETLPFDVRQLRQSVRRRRIGHLEVKKRGVAVDPETIRRKLQGTGDEQATLLITPLGGVVRAILSRRVQ